MVLFVSLMLITALISIFWVGVPYVPSSSRAIKKILELANLKPGQKVYDLGCGDGRFLIEAEKHSKIEGFGYEIAPIPYLLGHIFKVFNNSKIKIFLKDFSKISLNQADIIYCYLGPDATQKAATKAFNECKKGTKIITNTFKIQNKQPIFTFQQQAKFPSIYIYEI